MNTKAHLTPQFPLIEHIYDKSRSDCALLVDCKLLLLSTYSCRGCGAIIIYKYRVLLRRDLFNAAKLAEVCTVAL